MKKVKMIISITAITLGIIIFRAGMAAGAASSARPGTSGDPLITQSYLEQKLSEVAAASYNKVLLKKGKTIILDIGSEAILYNGTASVSGSKGLINLTEGLLSKNGSIVAAYNFYFSPDSASGIISSADCILYVKGTYTIK